LLLLYCFLFVPSDKKNLFHYFCKKITSFPNNYLYIKIKVATEMLCQLFLVFKRVGFLKQKGSVRQKLNFTENIDSILKKNFQNVSNNLE